jgi:hypothetical protein
MLLAQAAQIFLGQLVAHLGQVLNHISLANVMFIKAAAAAHFVQATSCCCAEVLHQPAVLDPCKSHASNPARKLRLQQNTWHLSQLLLCSGW